MPHRSGAETWKNYHGITSVDGHTFSAMLGSTLYVMEGRRVIGFVCPGHITVDTGPRITYDFEAGKSYVLDCGGTAEIHVATATP